MFGLQGVRSREFSVRRVSRVCCMAAFVALTFLSAVSDAGDVPFYVPSTVSEEAQTVLSNMSGECLTVPQPDDVEGWRVTQAAAEGHFQAANAEVVKQYRPAIKQLSIGGVPVLEIKPEDWEESDEVIVFLYGGGYTLLSANTTLSGSVLLASDTGMRVLAVDYTLAPHAKWDVVTDQVIDVFQGLVKDGQAVNRVAIVGHSSGGGLAAGAVLKMRDRGLTMPAAVVLRYPWSDITETGDTYHTLRDHDPAVCYEGFLDRSADAYADRQDQKNPYVSPVYGNFSAGFPPTLIQVGTKEIFLSNAVRLYQAMDNAGVEVKIDPYEGMWHGWVTNHPRLPEAKLARRKAARFLATHLGE